MIRTAVTVGGIAMARQNDLGVQVLSAGKGRVEVVEFKPEKHAISGRDVWVADRTVMMLCIPVVQLEDQPAVGNESFVVRTAMVALTANEMLIPATAGFDIAHANEGLWTHRNNRSFGCSFLNLRALTFLLLPEFGRQVLAEILRLENLPNLKHAALVVRIRAAPCPLDRFLE
jgi:hypothetical protein